MTAASAAVIVSGVAWQRPSHLGFVHGADYAAICPAKFLPVGGECRIHPGAARPERSIRTASAGWPPGCPEGSGATAPTAGRRMDDDPSDREFAGVHRVAMHDVRNTLSSRRRPTSMMCIEASFDLSISSGRLMFFGMLANQSKHLRRKKIAACFVFDESCLGRRKSSAPSRRRGVGGQNIDLFELATAGRFKFFSVPFCSSPRRRRAWFKSPHLVRFSERCVFTS